MRICIIFIILLCCMGGTVLLTSNYMEDRPALIKLGYAPDGKYFKYFVGDQKITLAAAYTLKSIMYYGDIIRQWKVDNSVEAELANMFGLLQSSIHLDPYNMDTYYFSQAAFTWEVGHAADVNRLLIHGMKYRHWDWMLPYFVGFNAGYFLKDYSTAGKYMKKAAELSGSRLLTTLAARYMHDSGSTVQAIGFLEAMLKDPLNEGSPFLKSLKVRKNALEAIWSIEQAVAKYRELYSSRPTSLSELIRLGFLNEIPQDPYGGDFYIDSQGAVKSTSHLSFSKSNKSEKGHK